MADTRPKRFYGFTGTETPEEIEAIVTMLVDAMVADAASGTQEDVRHDPIMGGSDAE